MVVLPQESRHGAVGFGCADGRQQVGLNGLAAGLREQLLAECLIAPQTLLGVLGPFGSPVFFQRLERFIHNQLAPHQSSTCTVDLADPLLLCLGQCQEQRVNADLVVLNADVAQEVLERLVAFVLLLGLALFLGVCPGVGIPQLAPAFDILRLCPLRLAAISLGLNAAV